MLFLALFVLFAIGAADSEEDDCRAMYYKCNIRNIRSEIPDTMEDLKKKCRVVRDSIKCMDEKRWKCNVEDVFDMRYLRDVAQFMETNCIEESSLSQALSQNYGCIQPIAKNVLSQCNPTEEELEEMKARDLPEPAKFCQHVLYEIICMGHIVGMQCGQQAKETAVEVLQNTLADFHACKEESVFTQLQPVKEKFEAAFAKESA